MPRKSVSLVGGIIITTVFSVTLICAQEAASPSPIGWWRFDGGKFPVVKDKTDQHNDIIVPEIFRLGDGVNLCRDRSKVVCFQFMKEGLFIPAGSFLLASTPESFDPYKGATLKLIVKIDNPGTLIRWGGMWGNSPEMVLDTDKLAIDVVFPDIRASRESVFSDKQVLACWNPSLSLNKWLDLTVTFSPREEKVMLYCNGLKSGEGNYWWPLTAGEIRIGNEGRYQWPIKPYLGTFSGIIKELKVYNRALTETEITAEYRQTKENFTESYPKTDKLKSDEEENKDAPHIAEISIDNVWRAMYLNNVVDVLNGFFSSDVQEYPDDWANVCVPSYGKGDHGYTLEAMPPAKILCEKVWNTKCRVLCKLNSKAFPEPDEEAFKFSTGKSIKAREILMDKWQIYDLGSAGGTKTDWRVFLVSSNPKLDIFVSSIWFTSSENSGWVIPAGWYQGDYDDTKWKTITNAGDLAAGTRDAPGMVVEMMDKKINSPKSVVLLRKAVEIPKEWQGKGVLCLKSGLQQMVHLVAEDSMTEQQVYFNGHRLSSEYEKYIIPGNTVNYGGKNVIAVRTVLPSDKSKPVSAPAQLWMEGYPVLPDWLKNETKKALPIGELYYRIDRVKMKGDEMATLDFAIMENGKPSKGLDPKVSFAGREFPVAPADDGGCYTAYFWDMNSGVKMVELVIDGMEPLPLAKIEITSPVTPILPKRFPYMSVCSLPVFNWGKYFINNSEKADFYRRVFRLAKHAGMGISYFAPHNEPISKELVQAALDEGIEYVPQMFPVQTEKINPRALKTYLEEFLPYYADRPVSKHAYRLGVDMISYYDAYRQVPVFGLQLGDETRLRSLKYWWWYYAGLIRRLGFDKPIYPLFNYVSYDSCKFIKDKTDDGIVLCGRTQGEKTAEAIEKAGATYWSFVDLGYAKHYGGADKQTPEEVRRRCYDALAHGAKGLLFHVSFLTGYYDGDVMIDMNGYPTKYYFEVGCELGAVINKLGDLLLRLETAENVVMPINEPNYTLPPNPWNISDQMIATTRKDKDGSQYIFLVNNNIKEKRALRIRLDCAKIKGTPKLQDLMSDEIIVPNKDGIYVCPDFKAGCGKLFKLKE